MLPMKALHGACNGQEKQYVDDVFSTYLYTGNGSTQTITNGIDLAGEGGLVWMKRRDSTNNHMLFDTARAAPKFLSSNTTTFSQAGNADTLTAFSSSGFTLGPDAVSYAVNASGFPYASWSFRRAPKFFELLTFTHTNGTASTVDLSALGTVGMVTVKATSTTSNWYTWHRSLTAGNNLKLNLTDAQSATNAYLSVSGTTLTIASTAPTATYVVYAFAHDTDPDGIIQCGSYTGNTTTMLGWEPQYIMYKRTDSTGDWIIVDSTRGIPTGSADQGLYPNLSNAEAASAADYITLNATGFTTTNLTGTFIYLAIRRPNKPPTSGTEVMHLHYGPGTGAARVIPATNAPIDFVWNRNASAEGSPHLYDRLRGSKRALNMAVDTSAEYDFGDLDFANSLGLQVNSSTDNATYATYLRWMLRRAPGFFDVVCYTGTGVARTVAHNLGVVPELMIVKHRLSSANWAVYAQPIGVANSLWLNTTNGSQAYGLTYWNKTVPTAAVFTLGTDAGVNNSTSPYVAYLFATLPGIQYINSYIGDGTTGRTINCGFSAGARFVCIKATSTTGSWWVFDSTRGIVSAADPALQLNSTAAEITSADAIDPTGVGFIVNQETTCNLNVNGVSYLVWAIA